MGIMPSPCFVQFFLLIFININILPQWGSPLLYSSKKNVDTSLATHDSKLSRRVPSAWKNTYYCITEYIIAD